MTRPTLEELYSLQEPMLDDNFDFDSIHFSEDVPHEIYQGILSYEAFQKVRLSLKGIHWIERTTEDSVLTLVFHEHLDDQVHLDAFAALKNEFSKFVFGIYCMSGAVARKITFNDPVFMSTETALDAANGKPVHRVMQFTFFDVTETAVKY